jgi:hypothetical protein
LVIFSPMNLCVWTLTRQPFLAAAFGARSTTLSVANLAASPNRASSPTDFSGRPYTMARRISFARRSHRLRALRSEAIGVTACWRGSGPDADLPDVHGRISRGLCWGEVHGSGGVSRLTSSGGRAVSSTAPKAGKAREYLEWCRHGHQKMRGNPTGPDWVLIWAGTISLLRAVGHALRVEDAKSDPRLDIRRRAIG